jgi:hypothetical protein
VIFLSDITMWLSDIGLSWERVGADFATAQNELERQPLGLFLTVSSMAYTILCSTARKPDALLQLRRSGRGAVRGT